MDAVDEPAMAYFLPNGIADDSPPKKSRKKASFGPIGGRNAVDTANQSAITSPGSPAAVSTASGAPNSKCDVDFSGLYSRPRPTLESSPFGSSGGPVLSPKPTNYLLSDLGGEIHTPRASRDSGGSSSNSSSPFGFPGPFGSGLSEGGTIGGAGAIRSPTSMFDRGQDAAESFSMPGESRRSVAASGAYGSADTHQLYRGGGISSYLDAGDAENPFGSNSMRPWQSSATETTQPRRVLQRPPGLAGPPGLGDPGAMDDMHTRTRTGRGAGGDLMQQRVLEPQFGPFRPSTSSPTASGSASNRGFPSGDGQYGSSLLSNLRLSTGAFGDPSLREQIDCRGVPNPDLAELNTHSVKVNELGGMHVQQAVDSSTAMWDSREPTTSRRIDIQARSRTPRSPKKPRDERRKLEGRSDLRAKALEFSMDAISVFTPESPMRPRRSERARKLASPMNALENSPTSYERNHPSGDQLAPRGRRRNQVTDKGSTSSTLSSGGNDMRGRGLTNQSEESDSVLAPPPGLESGDTPMKLTPRESAKARRREDTKSSSRSSSRRNLTRGNEKGASTTRRLVYREKQVKESPKEPTLHEEPAPSVSTTSNSPQGIQASSFGQETEAKPHDQKQNIAHEASCNAPITADLGSATDVAKSSIQTILERTDTSTMKPGKNDIEVVSGSTEDPKNLATDKTTNIARAGGALRNTTPEPPAASTERDSCSSSDVPEDGQAMSDELSHESRADSPESNDILSAVESSESDPERAQAVPGGQPAKSTMKSKRKTAISVPASTDTSLPVANTDTEPVLPPGPFQATIAERKHATKEHRKEKSKKDKGEKKKLSRSKKEKRASSLVPKVADTVHESATEAQDKILEALATKSTTLSSRISQGLRMGGSVAASAGLRAFVSTRRGCVWVAGRLNIKGLLATTFSYVESVLAMVFSVLLLLSLHAASWFIRIHRVAFRAILTHRHIGFCFAFLYGFPFLVQYVFPWAPPWAPVCLWYAFLVQLFCTNGPTAMVTTFRVILPLVFLIEGISHHSFLLDLNGAELLLTSFIISAVKTSNLCSPIFLLSLATQCLLAVFLGSELLVQWLQLALALYSLHVMAAPDDEWIGMGEEEDELSCHPVSMHHSIADYNNHPAPSSAVSIQKTKRLDRRALAYVRGRKLR